MRLVDIIKLKLKSLNEEYEENKDNSIVSSINELEKDLKLIEEFLNDFSDEKIIEVNINTYLNILFKYTDVQNKSKFIEEFRIITILLNGKYNEKLPLDLSNDQQETIRKFMNKLNDIKINLSVEIENKKALEKEKNKNIDVLVDDIINLEDLSEKIMSKDDKSLLTSEDFNIFYKIIEDKNISFDLKKEALIKFSEYNLYIMKTGNKKIEENVDMNLLIACFNNFGFGEDMVKLINKKGVKEEVMNNANLKNIKDILNFLSNENILNKFSLDSLLTLCVYGDVNEIKERYLEFKDELSDFHFNTPSIWIKKMTLERRKYIRRENKNNKKRESRNPLRDKLNINASYGDFKLNKKFLEEEFNIKVDARSYKEGRIIKILSSPNHVIKRNYELYKEYGIIDDNNLENFSISSLAFSATIKKIDKFIELGLLNNDHGALGHYINNNPSALQAYKDITYMFLYYLKENLSLEEYYSMLASEKIHGNIKKEFIQANFTSFGYNLKTEEEKEKFKNENFIDQTDSKYIQNAIGYNELISESDKITFDESILLEPRIKELENFKLENNKYIYVINNNIISRYKVLRICSILKENGIEMDENTILYAVTYGTYLSKNTFNLIKETLSYNKGEKDGLSRKI